VSLSEEDLRFLSQHRPEPAERPPFARTSAAIGDHGLKLRQFGTRDADGRGCFISAAFSNLQTGEEWGNIPASQSDGRDRKRKGKGRSHCTVAKQPGVRAEERASEPSEHAAGATEHAVPSTERAAKPSE
jgi:hypothetical protein